MIVDWESIARDTRVHGPMPITFECIGYVQPTGAPTIRTTLDTICSRTGQRITLTADRELPIVDNEFDALTALLALARRIYEHEVAEQFLYRRAPVFDPH